MGWVVFRKIYEDGQCVIYAYSHDSKIYDGRIKVPKIQRTEENGHLFDRYIHDITLSKTDPKRIFAIKVFVFLTKILWEETWEFPEYHMLAYG